MAVTVEIELRLKVVGHYVGGEADIILDVVRF
jgi:hypothetical protein